MEDSATNWLGNKYVQEDKLHQIVKKVQRDRRKVLEDKEWHSFLARQADQSNPFPEEATTPQQYYGHVTTVELQPDSLYLSTNTLAEQELTAVIPAESSTVPIASMHDVVSSHSQLDSAQQSSQNKREQRQLSPIDEEPQINAYSLRSESCCKACLSPSLLTIDPNNFQQSISDLKNSLVSLNSTIELIPKDIDSARMFQPQFHFGKPFQNNIINDGHLRRVEGFRKKISTTLDNIISLWDKIPPSDDLQDYNRRCKRATDFAAMLGRNYLYPLGRKIQRLQAQVRDGNFSNAMSKNLVDAHQYATNAMLAYLSHMPSSVQIGVPNKMRELLVYVVDLCELYCSLRITFDETGGDGDARSCDISSKSKDLLSVLDLESRKKETQPLIPRLQDNQKTTNVRAKNKAVTKKKSPYLIPLSVPLQRSINTLAKAKFGPPRQQRKRAEGNTILPIPSLSASKKVGSPERKQLLPADVFDDENIDTVIQHVSSEHFNSPSSMRETPNLEMKPIPALSSDGSSNLINKLLSEILEAIRKSEGSAPLEEMKHIIKRWKSHLIAKTNGSRESYIGANNARLIFVQSQSPEHESHTCQSASKSVVDSSEHKLLCETNLSITEVSRCQENNSRSWDDIGCVQDAPVQDYSPNVISDKRGDGVTYQINEDYHLKVLDNCEKKQETPPKMTSNVESSDQPILDDASPPIKDVPQLISELSNILVGDVFQDEIHFIDSLVSMMFKLEFQ